MSRVRPGLVAAISAVALTAGCASSSTTAAQDPAATTTTATSTAVPTAKMSPTSSPSPEATSATARALPDGYDANRNAKADIQAALATAAKEHREVLIDFGANWCPDCKVLDAMFHSAQVEPLLQKDYVVVAVDVGEFDHNIDLASKYVDLQTSGIPALVVLQPDGTLRTATNDGSFANAQSMDASQVSAFLTRWAPGGNQ
ncbi:thioredoxin family protein [Streptomyces sp. NPDC058107]|uniref:thioredoxin family protein n=1 Tax=Streptomyces sp. NPDC058107 TaxID=3346343 RepID=UPI0036E3490E